MFDAQKVTNDMIEWIRKWFYENGKDCKAVIGISGGKDSSIVAAACKEALGRERVIGVLMPNVQQADIEDSYKLIKHLQIQHYLVPIGLITADMKNQLVHAGLELTTQATINMPARIRMSALYAVSQCVSGRVANTCNLSEDWIGYSTRWGDSVGDFSPLSKLTVTEVKAVGRVLGLPEELIEKVPTDGLSGHTDEENFGFSYDTLDRYIRTGVCEDEKIRNRIDLLHRMSAFKLQMPPSFEYNP